MHNKKRYKLLSIIINLIIKSTELTQSERIILGANKKS